MPRSGGITLVRRVDGKEHRTHFKKYRATVAGCLISVWDRAARMGIAWDLKDLFDQYI